MVGEPAFAGRRSVAKELESRIAAAGTTPMGKPLAERHPLGKPAVTVLHGLLIDAPLADPGPSGARP